LSAGIRDEAYRYKLNEDLFEALAEIDDLTVWCGATCWGCPQGDEGEHPACDCEYRRALA